MLHGWSSVIGHRIPFSSLQFATIAFILSWLQEKTVVQFFVNSMFLSSIEIIAWTPSANSTCTIDQHVWCCLPPGSWRRRWTARQLYCHHCESRIYFSSKHCSFSKNFVLKFYVRIFYCFVYLQIQLLPSFICNMFAICFILDSLSITASGLKHACN